MKTYEFKVQVGDFVSGDEFVSEMLAEVNKSKSDKELSRKINTETSKVHNEIVLDVSDKLNAIFSQLGGTISVSREASHTFKNLGYSNKVMYINFSDKVVYSFTLSGIIDKEFDSEFNTYTGSYKVTFVVDSATYTIFEGDDIVGRILEILRPKIKKHLME